MQNPINKEELLEVLKITPAKQNIMIAGNHGIGKSQIITDYFTKKKMRVVTLFLGQMSDPGDLIGLPQFDKKSGCTIFSPPYWFPIDEKPIVLFLDELNRARPEILQTIMDLALNKKLAGRSLPEGSRIISAVNSGDEYQLTDLDPALASRFNIYTFSPSPEEWLKWAESKKFDTRILHYIRLKPARLDSFNLDEDESDLTKTPDRRAWEKVNDILHSISDLKPIHAKILSGLIGDATALDFVAAESAREKNKISGLDLLEKGYEILAKLAPCQIYEYAEIIDSVFENLEAADSLPIKKSKSYANNLKAFVLWLNEHKKYESLAYFTSLYTDSKLKKAKSFIQENCPVLVESIIEFVKNYELAT